MKEIKQPKIKQLLGPYVLNGKFLVIKVIKQKHINFFFILLQSLKRFTYLNASHFNLQTQGHDNVFLLQVVILNSHFFKFQRK